MKTRIRNAASKMRRRENTSQMRLRETTSLLLSLRNPRRNARRKLSAMQAYHRALHFSASAGSERVNRQCGDSAFFSMGWGQDDTKGIASNDEPADDGLCTIHACFMTENEQFHL